MKPSILSLGFVSMLVCLAHNFAAQAEEPLTTVEEELIQIWIDQMWIEQEQQEDARIRPFRLTELACFMHSLFPNMPSEHTMNPVLRRFAELEKRTPAVRAQLRAINEKSEHTIFNPARIELPPVTMIRWFLKNKPEYLNSKEKMAGVILHWLEALQNSSPEQK